MINWGCGKGVEQKKKKKPKIAWDTALIFY